jgi:CRISPR system Cascade subunit CasC
MGKAVDIALSGRMATSGLMSNLPVDGALAVAHAITTHAVEPQDVDWFTAVDDLTQDAGETGAGHLDTQQFSSGVFYRYASLNLKQLQVNLGLLPDMKSAETAESRQRGLDIARHVFHLLATVVPSAKQQSFAAHNLADFAIVSFADQPISLANAFEQPVKRDYKNAGFLKPSVEMLADYWARMNRAYSLDEEARAFAVADDAKLGNQVALGSLKEMEAWIANGGQA